MVSLKKLDGRSKLITGYIIGEKFELSGKLDVPTRCELVLDNYDYLVLEENGSRDVGLILISLLKTGNSLLPRLILTVCRNLSGNTIYVKRKITK